MKELLSCVLDIGEQMLLCGAEVHRVEDSVKRMCYAFGATRVDVFIITSTMITTVYNQEHMPFTQTRRITGTGTDIERLHKLNALSRRICSKQMTIQEIRGEIEEILKTKCYPFWLECVSCALIAGAFTLFFGGTLIEALVSLVVGTLIKLVLRFTEFALMNAVFAKFLCTFLASVLAFGAMKAGVIGNIDKVMIGNIMSLIPGIGLTAAMRDLFTGDSIAGLLHTFDAVMTALAIAAGYFLFTCTLGGL